ncbi:MAG: RHS repeat domain-containing protein, partial [Planctomycetota bacterium]
DYYYGHDHLYSPVVVFGVAGGLVQGERYEYDAYGEVSVMSGGYVSRSASTIGNPYTFTGRRLDMLDGGDLKLMYYRARTYDPQTGRFMQRDPLGIDPASGNRNPFNPTIQYNDDTNIYKYSLSSPVNYSDAWGTMANKIPKSEIDDCCEPMEEWDTPGDGNFWSFPQARLHFHIGSGKTKEFPAGSNFSNFVKNNIEGLVSTKHDWINEGLDTVMEYYAKRIRPTECRRFGLGGKFDNYAYYSGAAKWWKAYMAGTIGSGNGNEQDYSNLLYNTDCCFKKECCISGGVAKVKVKCKVQITLRDLYGYHYNPNHAKWGTNFWTVVHWFQDYQQEFTVPCN